MVIYSYVRKCMRGYLLYREFTAEFFPHLRW
jgi:hypothetical protein